MAHRLGPIFRWCVQNGLPPLTAIVVRDGLVAFVKTKDGPAQGG